MLDILNKMSNNGKEDFDDYENPYTDENEANDNDDGDSAQDNEYYSFMHVPRCASQEDITAAYKKLSRLYHPDKHRDEEKKKYAEAMFDKLQKAYAVIGDPHKRAIYDCLGKEGVESGISSLIPRNKAPKEIYEEYERLAKYV